MKREQISTFLNESIKEVIGESEIVKEDLSNIVTIGTNIPNASFDAIFSKIIDKIGKTIVVSKDYQGNSLGLLVDDWIFGSMLEKIRVDIPETEENESWKLVKGESYDCFKFSPPNIRVKYFNKSVTFQIAMSYTDIQMRDSFRNAGAVMSFWNGVEKAIQTSIKANTQLMEYRTLSNMIAIKIKNKSNVVNLLTEYNTRYGTNLTPSQALENESFLRFSGKIISMYKDYLNGLSMLFNDDRYVTSTNTGDERLILLSDFDKSMKFNLYSNTFNKEFVDIGSYKTVTSWQGSGKSISFDNNSKIDLKITGTDGLTADVTASGIVGVLFDINACAVCRKNYRTLSTPVPAGEFTNFWYKYDCSYINDTAENFIVFTISQE